MSFLSAQNTESAPKRIFDLRTYKKIARACLSCVEINPQHIPIQRDDKPLVFGAFDDTLCDPLSRAYIHTSVARLDKGIPNEKERPVIPTPWGLKFILKLYPSPDLNEEQLKLIFVEGGQRIGLGTYRGVFGKFQVESWV